MSRIGITERGDAALNTAWQNWVGDLLPAILITKDPVKLLNKIKETKTLNGSNPNIIVHCGITGHGNTVVEPNVPSVEESLEGYKQLIRLLGKERVILRLDPVFPSQKGLDRAAKIVTQHLDTRIRMAFLQAYPHVKERFKKAKLTQPPYKFYAPLEERKRIHKELERIAGKRIEICGEPGLKCQGCISPIDCKIFNVIPYHCISKQRKHCACLAQKKELLNNKNRCAHNCIYCYWK